MELVAAACIVACLAAAGAARGSPTDLVQAANAAIEAKARAAPRGVYPRAFSGEQSYWTIVGVDGGAANGLISEDGAIELGKGGASIEPFVIDAGRLSTWADVTISQSLEDGYLPIPSVDWRRRGWNLRITCFAFGDPSHPQLGARYQLRSFAKRPQRLALVLAVRPLQVDGPEQFLNAPGGVSPLHDLGWDGSHLTLNGRKRVLVLTPGSRFTAEPVDLASLRGSQSSASAREASVHDPAGFASGALIYRFTLPAHGRATVEWIALLTDAGPRVAPSPVAFRQALAATARDWRRRLGRVSLIMPPREGVAADTLRTSLAYMLISRRGPILRPGTRSYDRSWIRDGAMISEALLRLGETRVVQDYLRWYAPFQFSGGKAPCCVDARGPDPTPENDSEGEFIFLAAEAYRYSGDLPLLRSMWPHVLAAADYMDGLRRREPATESDGPDRQATQGLLSPSISHEGYSDKPAYSYWDDFWGLRGYKDAVFISETLGETTAAARLSRNRDDFRLDLLASLQASVRAHGIDYLPGSADRGDFDPTSTTIALAPGGEAAALPADLLNNTFESNWQRFVKRRDADRAWDAYTPYELRTIGTYVRLGWRDRAAAALDFYLKDRRPLAWNGWAEVVGRDLRKPRFIGDMPHAWVASDFVGSVLDMFAYEREDDASLVLGAGIPADWFRQSEVGVRGLRTPYGVLNWSAKTRADRLTVRVSGDARPPGGFVIPWPFAERPGPARFNGHALSWNADAVRLEGPGELIVDLRQATDRGAGGRGKALPSVSNR